MNSAIKKNFKVKKEGKKKQTRACKNVQHRSARWQRRGKLIISEDFAAVERICL